MRRRATRNQTVKKLAALPSSPALRLLPAPAAFVSDCLALFSAPVVSAGGTPYSGLRHRQQLFANFFARCDFDEHRFGRPPHLRGGVDSGFRFWVNKFVEKCFVPSLQRDAALAQSFTESEGVLPMRNWFGMILPRHRFPARKNLRGGGRRAAWTHQDFSPTQPFAPAKTMYIPCTETMPSPQAEVLITVDGRRHARHVLTPSDY